MLVIILKILTCKTHENQEAINPMDEKCQHNCNYVMILDFAVVIKIESAAK